MLIKQSSTQAVHLHDSDSFVILLQGFGVHIAVLRELVAQAATKIHHSLHREFVISGMAGVIYALAVMTKRIPIK